MLAYAVDSDEMNDHAHGAKEMTVYHYMSPRKMLHADLRATHEKLDRMVNAGAGQAIVDFFRSFVDTHFESLRRRQAEVKYQAEKCEHCEVEAAGAAKVAKGTLARHRPGSSGSKFGDIPEILHKHDNLVNGNDHSSAR